MGLPPITLQKARQLRNHLTNEEELLWERLKNKQICKVRFRRQHPIGQFIVDFYCHSAKLVIEIDGKIHLQRQKYDIERTQTLEELGLKVIRFSNSEINSKIDFVIKQISQTVLTIET